MTDALPGGTPYEILGVPRDAPAETLRRAYRRRLRETHPDTGGSADGFHQVQQAWELVGTPAARRAYDARSARTTRPTDRSRSASPAPSASTPDDGPRVWTAGRTSGEARPRPKARSHGHPGGWSRERYLTLLREWVGRGVDIPDPYDATLVARAPREIRHALADARAEEATARELATLGSAFTIWHDVATARGHEGWSRDAGAPRTDPAKLDHVILGPTGLIVAQSEDWGAPVRRKGKELVSEGLAAGERPVKALTRRARVTRSWGVRHSALLLVLEDSQLEAMAVPLGGSRGVPRFAIRRSALAGTLTVGLPGVPIVAEDQIFDQRTRLHQAIRFA
ncbi:J domain-containing protein [Ruania alba]|uniref:Nuclease-related domain-containing protein n=1 Tax=Ruania alba TaxID=648782 RepID=A0A1H5M7X7_9MICO|nr:DnaJ domain-containing protein [Ruania alba]SEE84488.1 Nuclease-related domain-containing protein [Ruania alba]